LGIRIQKSNLPDSGEGKDLQYFPGQHSPLQADSVQEKGRKPDDKQEASLFLGLSEVGGEGKLHSGPDFPD